MGATQIRKKIKIQSKVIVSLFLSTSISVVMMKPLRGVLNQLCPGSHATNFWMSFTTVMLYVTPLLFVGTVMVADSVNIVRTALASSLFGAFAALLVVGYQISRARPLPARSMQHALDPCLRWVHSGESRSLRGSVTVECGSGVVARMLGVLASLPAAMWGAPIEVRIEVSGTGEKWVRLFAGHHLMVSTLKTDGDLLVERLGPAALKFRLAVRDGTLEWVLEHIAAFGIALPLKSFRIAATIKARDGRNHFVVDSELIGVGRIVRYEGLLDAAA